MSIAEFGCNGESLAEALFGRFFIFYQAAALFLMSAQFHQDRVLLSNLLRFLYGICVFVQELLTGCRDALDKEITDFLAV